MLAVPPQRCNRAIRGLPSRSSYCFLPQNVECVAAPAPAWCLPSRRRFCKPSPWWLTPLLLVSQALAYLYPVSHCSTITFTRSISGHLEKTSRDSTAITRAPGVRTRHPVFTAYERQIY